ncbi:hypothetical protein ACSQ6I_00035 [Anabaena sp. WFMT]
MYPVYNVVDLATREVQNFAMNEVTSLMVSMMPLRAITTECFS